MNNVIDSIQVSGTVYTLSAQTEGGGVPESAFTAYTASTNERISQDEEATAAALNDLNEAVSGLNESVSGKQDTLIAGDYITIDTANTISTSGLVTVADNEVAEQKTINSGNWFDSSYRPTPINGDSYSTSFDIVEDSINGGEYGQQCNYNTNIIITLIDSSGNTVSGSVGNGYITAATPSDIIPSNMTSYLDAQISIGERNGYVKYSGKNGWRIKYISDVPLGGLYTIGVYTATRIDFPGGQSARVIENTVFPELKELSQALSGKQDTLVSGTNIKTINNESLLGSGNIDIQGGAGTVESAITSGSTNAVESKAIWSATTFNKNVLLTFNDRRSTNYPEGCTKLIVEVAGYGNMSNIDFFNDDQPLGVITIDNTNWQGISVDINFDGASYEISGTTVIITYPTVTVTKIRVGGDTSYTYTAVVEGAWVNENTYMKSEVDAIANGLQNNINSKLDATAYTPTVVDSALNVTSQNPVQNQTLYSELRIANGETETTLTFENEESTNYPNGCTKLNVEVVGSGNYSNIDFFNDNDDHLGNIRIDNWAGIMVNNTFEGASYEISGTTVIITYPTVTSVTKIRTDGLGNYVYKAITSSTIPLKDKVVANTTALGSKQDTLVSGTNIKTINNTSILGSGNIDIQGGGGKAIEAGRGISVATGETADTVSFNLPISAGTGSNSIIEGESVANGDNSHAEGNGDAEGNYSHAEGSDSFANGFSSHAEGQTTIANGNSSHAEGSYTTASGNFSHTEGFSTKTTNQAEHASGKFNVSSSASTTFGNSGNTLFSVGNGTSNSRRHNAFEIRQNGDIYLTLDGQDVKLQDHLGGGGSSYTAGDGIDITNDVISVTGKVDTSTYNTYTAATDTALASKQTTLTAGTNITIIDNVISAEGGGLTEDDELLLATALTDLNDRKIDASEVKSNYQRKGDYVTKTYVTTALEPYETKANVEQVEEVTAYALNDLNERFGGLKIVKITESEYAALTTKDENTLYIVVADPS